MIIPHSKYNLLKPLEKMKANDNKRVESEFFAIFPVEVTKTSFTTNCDHSKNFAALGLSKSNKIVVCSFQCSESCVIKIQVLTFFFESKAVFCKLSY